MLNACEDFGWTWHWTRPLRRFIAGLTLSLSVLSMAHAVQANPKPSQSGVAAGTSCPIMYHAALQKLGLRHTPSLADALDRILTSRPGIPSDWTFWRTSRRFAQFKRRAKNGQVAPLTSRGRVCVNETTSSRGRAVCQQWEPATEERVAELTVWLPPPDPRPGWRERAGLRLLTDTLKTQGALTGFQEGGKFYWLVRRLVEDLNGYLAQPPTRGICAGVATMIGFYRQQLGPLSTRIRDLRQIERGARQRLEGYVKTIETRRARRQASVEAPSGDAQPTALAQPRESDQRPDTLVTWVSRIVSPIAPDEKAATALRARDVPAVLSFARDWVDRLAYWQSVRATDRAEIVRALRAVETAFIAAATVRIYGEFKMAVEATLASISRKQAELCVCR